MNLKTTLLILLFSISAWAQVVPTVHNDLSDGNTYDGYTDMDIYGNSLYISNSDAGVILRVDISAPDAVPTVFLSGLNYPTGVKVSGNELYFFEAADEDFTPGSGRLLKIDLSNPVATPVQIVGSLSYPLQLDIANSYVYFVETYYDNNDDFLYSDVSMANLTGVASKTVIMGQRESVDDIEIAGNSLYMVEFSFTLEEINIFKSDISTGTPSAPVLFYADPGFAPYKLEIHGNKMYFNADDDDNPIVYEIDLSAPNPVATAAVGPFVFNGGGTYVDEIVISDTNIMYAFGDSWNGEQSYLIYRADLNAMGTEKNSKLSLTAYPNPVTDYLSVNGLEAAAEYSIIDVTGKLLAKGTINPGSTINTGSLQSGVYLLSVDSAPAIRFVKK